MGEILDDELHRLINLSTAVKNITHGQLSTLKYIEEW